MKLATYLSALCLAFGTLAKAQDQPDPLKAIESKLTDKSKPFTMIVQLAIKADKVEEFRAAAEKAVAATRQEKGNLSYEVHQSLDDKTRFVFFERWRNFDALKAHFGEAHTKAILAALGEIGAAPPKIDLYAPYVVREKEAK